MPRSSTGPKPRGSLVILVVLVLALAVCLVTLKANRPGFVPTTSAAKFPAGRTDAEPADLVPTAAAAPAQSTKPNIITILTDDMRADDIR